MKSQYWVRGLIALFILLSFGEHGQSKKESFAV